MATLPNDMNVEYIAKIVGIVISTIMADNSPPSTSPKPSTPQTRRRDEYHGSTTSEYRPIPSPRKTRNSKMTPARKEYTTYIRRSINKYNLKSRLNPNLMDAVKEIIKDLNFSPESRTFNQVRHDVGEAIDNKNRYQRKRRLKKEMGNAALNEEGLGEFQRRPYNDMSEKDLRGNKERHNEVQKVEERGATVKDVEKDSQGDPAYERGQLLAVEYDDTWYPAELLDIYEGNYQVSFMERKGKNKFIWPSREDILWVEKGQIIMRLSELCPSGRYCKLTKRDLSALNDPKPT